MRRLGEQSQLETPLLPLHTCDDIIRRQSERQERKHMLSVSVPPRSRADSVPPLPGATSLLSANCGDISPLRWKAAPPLLRRQTTQRQRPRVFFNAFPGNAAFDALSFPQALDCAHCCRQLTMAEAQRGTGLCDCCWETCLKDCSICGSKLPLKQLQWGSGLCRFCFEACDKECKMCGSNLAEGQLQWGTGLCDSCYNSCEKTCRICQLRLEPGQLRWGSGLCDECYNSSQKTCRICNKKLQFRQLRWGSGLCDLCYDESEKTCRLCTSNISLGSMHYRTGLCDTCYDNCEKNCKLCNTRLKQLPNSIGLCDLCYSETEKTCQMCRWDIDSQQLHWGTGLCDSCYNACEKNCKFCGGGILFGQLHWGSGLCNNCYASCEKTCAKCQSRLPLGQLHWGTRLCDVCFDKCEKTCRGCDSRLNIGQLHWGTGLCDSCYDAGQQESTTGLSRSVRASIGAQLIFYMGPGLLQPSLYLQIQAASHGINAPGTYAAVLMTASIAAMVFPLPLGLWAEWRGEGEVYYGISLVSALGAAVLATLPPAPVFAVCWALLTGPPAIRGVRAAFFAKHVPPEELSRAGQLASSAGLMGGFVGPIGSAAMSQAFGNGSNGVWPNGFAASAALASLSSATCAAALAVCMPRKKVTLKPSGPKGSNSPSVEQCERCRSELRAHEREYAALALCDSCYNNFDGKNTNFRQFRRRVLMGFCLIASFLECSMNAGITATFQPIVVGHFNWGNNAIALVNFTGIGLSVMVSILMTLMRLKERTQTAAAVVLYCSGVLLYTAQPLREWRLVVGLMLGIKAQILFMAPWTAIFSRLIGRMRVTNWLTTALCLAPAIGAAVGTAAAPWFIGVCNTPLFMIAPLPALLAAVGIALGWRRIEV